MRQPDVFLFDEPLSNLDAKLRVQMRIEIKALQRKLGVTSLYVTHDQVEAMTLADRMIVMNGGHVEQIGAPLEVYERPATLFAAQFIGSPAMNVWSGAAQDGAVRLENGAMITVDAGSAREVKVGVRPEHLVPDPEGPIVVETAMSEPLGATTLVHGRLAGTGSEVVVSLEGIRRPSDLEGELRLSASTIHLFDRGTGRRIATL